MENNNAQKIMIQGLVDSLLQSWWTVVAGLCLGLAAALLVLNTVPPAYQAETSLDAYAEMLPHEMVRPTVSEDTGVQLKTLRDAVLSRPFVSTLVPEITRRTSVEDPAALVTNILRETRVMHRSRAREFYISYRDTDPRRAAVVANTVAEAFVEENRRLRASIAGATTDTLETLAAGTLAKLQERERAILEFGSRHRLGTEEHLPLNYRELEDLDRRIAANESAQQVGQENLDLLRVQRDWNTEASPFMDAYGDDTAASDEIPAGASGVAKLRAEIAQLRLRYSENHPDVLAKLRELEDLMARTSTEPDVAPGDTPAEMTPEEPGFEIWDLQIRTAERGLEKLRTEHQELLRKKAQVERRIGSTPRVAQQYDELSRDVEILRAEYRSYLSKIESAKAAQTVEEEQKGSQFRILVAAVAPSTPVSPQPLLVIGIGALAGLLIFVGPVLIKQILRPIVRSEEALRALCDVPVLIRIPSLDNAATARRVRRNRLKNATFSALSAAVLIAAVALLYSEKL